MMWKPALILLLFSISLQLQFVKAQSPWSPSSYVRQHTISSASSLIKEVKQFFKNGEESLREKSLCQHLNTAVDQLHFAGKINFTSNSEFPDNSLLDNVQFWGSASLPNELLSPTNLRLERDAVYLQNLRYRDRRHANTSDDKTVTVTVNQGEEVSLPDVIFPDLNSSGLPRSQLLNMSFNCDSGKVNIHTILNGSFEVIPQVLNFSDVVLSMRVYISSNVTFDTLILSANTTIFDESMYLAVKYNFTKRKFSFPSSLIVSVQQIMNHLATLKAVKDKLPKAITDILTSKITAFSYDSSNKVISLNTTTSEITLVPNIIKLTDVTFGIEASIGSSPSLKYLSFSGTWTIGKGKVTIATNGVYDREKMLFHLTAVPSGVSTLSADGLVRKITGSSYHAPKRLALFTLGQIVGNIYKNGRFFIALQGGVAGGKIYVLFYKGASGLKTGFVASVPKFKLADVIRSTTGVDISPVPFFGTVVVHSLGVSITSGEIKSTSLPHIFGPSSPLYAYGDTLPAGVNANFKLSIKNITGSFMNGVISFKPAKGFSLESLYGIIPGLNKSLNSLPSQLKGILSATILSFQFNTSSKEISISASLQTLVIVHHFLKLSSVKITYDGLLRKPITTNFIDFKGTWKIEDFSIDTQVTYDRNTKVLDLSGVATSKKKQRVGEFLEAIAGNDLILLSALNSISFTSVRGKILRNEALVVFDGLIGSNGTISIVIHRRPSKTVVAVAADVTSFKLSDLIHTVTGHNTSSLPLIGSIVIPELKFAAATGNIKILVPEVITNDSALEFFKDGIEKGISAKFRIDIGDASNISVNYIHKKLSFYIPPGTTLTLKSLVSSLPKRQSDASQSLPPNFHNILETKVTLLNYDPESKLLQVSGSLDKSIAIVPRFLTLTDIHISLTLLLAPGKYSIDKLDFKGDWVLNNIPIHTTVTYNKEENELDIRGEVGRENERVNIRKFIKELTGKTLPIPSRISSSMSLSKLIGNKVGNTTFICLTGSIGAANIYLMYEKSEAGSSVAVAVDTSKFRFASLVLSATGSDISSFPFFGTLIIYKIGFTIASNSISNPLLATLYKPDSQLTNFAQQISAGFEGYFKFNMDGKMGYISDDSSQDSSDSGEGLVASFINKELKIEVPDSQELSMAKILKYIPGVDHVLDSLPTTLRDITNTRLHKLYYVPLDKKLQFSGSLSLLTIIPKILTLRNISLDMAGVIGEKPVVESFDLKGNWNLRSLSLFTTVTYHDSVVMVKAKPNNSSGINVKSLFKALTGRDVRVPVAINILEFTRVVGKVADGTTSIVFLGRVKDIANVAIVYQKINTKKVIALAGDAKSFKLAELVKTGSGRDISSVPYFGELIIPTLSFILSSAEFSSATLPDIDGPGTPKDLLLDTIPKGLKGHFEMDMSDVGEVFGLNADYSDNTLTITTPSNVSLSLVTLLSKIPSVKPTFDSLPSTVKNILNARITKIIFKTVTKNLDLSLELTNLTIVPKIIALKDVKIHLDVDLVSNTNTGNLSAFEASDDEQSDIAADEIVSAQKATVNNFQMKAIWVIRSLSIATTITYDKDGGKLLIKGKPTGAKTLGITDILKSFAKSNLKVPDFLSSFKMTQVLADINHEWTNIIISGRVGSTAKVYLIFDIVGKRKQVAIAAKIQQIQLADLVKTISGRNISKIPFLGKFKVTDMTFSAATNIIDNSHFASAIDSDSPLQAYDEGIPKGISANFKAGIGDKIKVEVTYKDKNFDFSIPPDATLTLQALLAEIPHFEEKVKKLPPPINELLGCNLETFRYDQDTTMLSIVAHYPQLHIIPKLMSMKNLDINIEAKLSAGEKYVESITFEGEWIFRKINISVNVSYSRDSGEISFTAISENGLGISDLITSFSGTTLPIPSTVNSAKLMEIVGRKTKDHFTFIFTGTIAGKANVHLIYQKYGTTSNIAVAVGIKSFRLSELLKSAAKIDITPIPFFGSFSVPTMAFIVTKSELTVPLLSQVISENSPLSMYGTTLPSGFTAEFDFSVGKVMGVVGSYRNRILNFNVPDNVDVSLGALASEIPGLNVKSLKLPSIVGDILKIRLHNFSLNVPKKTISLEVFTKKMSFLDNMLTITKTSLKLMAKLTPPRSISAEVRGVVALGGTEIGTSIRKYAGKYVISLNTKVISIYSIVKSLGAQMLPGGLQAALGHIFKFKILNVEIKYPFGVEPQQIMISGTPKLWGLRTVKMTAVAFKYGNNMQIVQKFDLGNFKLVVFIKKLLGVSLHKIAFLNQERSISFIMSPVSVPPNTIKVANFSQASPNEGISFSIPLGFPPNCEKDSFCAVCQSILGKDAKLLLEASILSADSFMLRASVTDIKLGSGVIMLKAGLEIQGGLEPTIGIAGYIQLKKPDVTIGAAIRATTSGVELEGSLSGCIPKFLGMDYITICNLLLSLTLIPTPLPVSALEFGVRIEVGKKTCGKKFIAAGYVGIDVINPSENYYYASVNQLTFQTFFDAFCTHVKLPRPLAESGFPEGLKASFSLVGKQLPTAKITIPAGVYFRGAMDILGLRAHAIISIKPYRTFVNITLPPISVAGIFKMYVSSKDKSRGPYLIADISFSKNSYLKASGYVELLGISAETKLVISSKTFLFFIKGTFLNLYGASLRVEASYGNIAKANFVVEGWFKDDLFSKIVTGVRNALKKSANEASKHINAAQEKIRRKKEAFNRVDRKLVAAQRKVDSAKRSFDRAIAKLERARRRVHHICRIKRCGSFCIGCPRGWKCCGHVWGKCVCKRPGWNSCCMRAPDIPCNAANLACRALRKTANLALRIAIAIVDKSRHILDVAKAALAIARGLVKAAKHTLDIAIGFLEVVKKTYSVGVKALSAVVNFVATKIIYIKEIYFKVGLNVAQGGVFQCRVKGVLMGNHINIYLKFDTKHILTIIKALGEKAIHGLSKFIG